MKELREYNGTSMAPRLCNGMIPAVVTRLKTVRVPRGATQSEPGSSAALAALLLRVGLGLVLACDDHACLYIIFWSSSEMSAQG